jgi:hypothetical protein
MLTESKTRKWVCIESESVDSRNWVQVAFRFSKGSQKEYWVFGEILGEKFSEDFYYDDTKRLAYEYYTEKILILENGSVYCVECGEFADNKEFANSVSQTSGYCLDCAPDSEDTEATRWH